MEPAHTRDSKDSAQSLERDIREGIASMMGTVSRVDLLYKTVLDDFKPMQGKHLRLNAPEIELLKGMGIRQQEIKSRIEEIRKDTEEMNVKLDLLLQIERKAS